MLDKIEALFKCNVIDIIILFNRNTSQTFMLYNIRKIPDFVLQKNSVVIVHQKFRIKVMGQNLIILIYINEHDMSCNQLVRFHFNNQLSKKQYINLKCMHYPVLY